MNSNGAVLLEPPKKIAKTFYICDKQFALDPILEMYKEENKIGVVLIDGNSFGIYLIIKSGSHYENRKLYDDDVIPIKRHNKGGYSANRYARQTDEKEAIYIKMISEITIKHLMKNNNTTYLVKKLIIAGPSNKKNYLQENELIQQYFKNELIMLNTSELTEQIIHETLQDCHKYFDEESDNKYNNIINKLQQLISTADDRLLFGFEEIVQAIQENTIKEIYISDELANQFDHLELNKCELIIIPDQYFSKIGINIIGITWYNFLYERKSR